MRLSLTMDEEKELLSHIAEQNSRIAELEKEIKARDRALNFMACDLDVEGVPSSLGYYLKKARAELERVTYEDC